MFMSATRTLRATRAPPSRQTRATACSSGRARDAKTPDVAHAERWVTQRVEAAAAAADARRQGERQPQASQQEHPEVFGRQATAADVGRAVSARPAWGPACESSRAREAGLR